MPEEKEKKETEKDIQDKKKEEPWWRSIPTPVLVIALIIAMVIISSMMNDWEHRNKYFLYLAGLFVMLFVLSRGTQRVDAGILMPKEAEYLLEKEIHRKILDGQWSPMTKYKIGPINRMHLLDDNPKYYRIPVKIMQPYLRPEYWISYIIPSGPMKGFVWICKSIGEPNGREEPDEKYLVNPEIFKMRKDPFLKDIYLRGMFK